MVTVVTRAANGIPLTHEQVDSNFTGLANAVNSIGSDVLAEAVAAKDVAVSAADAASISALNASISANSASMSSGSAAASAEQSATSASQAAASAISALESAQSASTYVGSLNLQDGASKVGSIRNADGAVKRSVQENQDSYSVTLEQFGAGVSGTTDVQAWTKAAAYCATTKMDILLTRVYSIDSNITVPIGVNVRGNNRVYSGLLFSGTASMTEAGTTGTKNGGNQVFSDMLYSHATSGFALNLSEFKDITFSNVVFYHVSLALAAFSYLNFLDCVGFDFGITCFNSVNQLNEAPKWTNCRFSNLKLRISETTDPQFVNFHNLGPDAQVSIIRGENPSGLYPVVQMSNVVLDSSNDEALVIVGCNVKVSNVFISAGRANSKSGAYLEDCLETTLEGVIARYCGASGVQTTSCKGIRHIGCDYDDNKVAGVSMTTCDGSKYIGCNFGNIPDWYGGRFDQQYGIVDTAGNSTDTLLDNNSFNGNILGPVYLPDPSTVYGINIGILRHKDGAASVVTSAGLAQIAHGLPGVPKYANAQALTNGDQKTQTTSVDGTYIYIRISTASSNAPLSGEYEVFWTANL